MRRTSRRVSAIGTALGLAVGLVLIPFPGTPLASATPPSAPSFDTPPDDYATKDLVTACDMRQPLNKPGVVYFMDRILDAYPGTRSIGIHNGCIKKAGEHWAGRAWDWQVNAKDPAQLAMATELLDWLFATREGYAHAYARRFGIMYIIYNSKIYAAYPEGGADRFKDRPNTAEPHEDHMHFSFSVKGAAKQTTWWTGRGPANRLDVFARGGQNHQNQLVHKYYRDGRWTEAWEDLGAGLESGPEVASWAERRLDVFAKAPDTFGGVLMHKWFADNRWQPSNGWEFLTGSGTLHSEPTAVSWGRRRIDVFAKGISGQLIHTWFDDGVWRHEDLGYLGGRLDSAPDVASWAPGRLDVFAKSEDRQLLHWWFDDNGWHHVQELRGPIDSAPTAVSWGPERIDVFAAGYPDHDLVHRWYQRGSDWQPTTQWESLGGMLVGGPDAASWGFGRLDVFVRSTSKDIRHKYFVRGRGWSQDFDSLGGDLASDPTAVSWTI